MKVRASKIKSNLEYDYESFLLAEFSEDLEDFIPYSELSCNHCEESESLEHHVDSPLSFLVKFKADVLRDPKVVKGGVKAYVLPDNFTYSKERGDSHFQSISENHYNLSLNSDETKQMASEIFKDRSLTRAYKIDDINRYIIRSYEQSEWMDLMAREDRKQWKKFLKRALKQSLIDDYGPIEVSSLKKAAIKDPEGLKQRVDKVLKFSGFEHKELKALKNAGVI